MENAFNKDQILIIIPVFNESGRIGGVVSELKSHGFGQVLVIDDGSVDNSATEAAGKGAKVLIHLINRGAGAATETGLQYFRQQSHLKLAVTIDGDNQHSPSDIDHLVRAHVESEADLTIGDRFMSGENKIPLSRIIYNRIADIITSVLSWKMVKDSQSGFKVWSRRSAELIRIEQNGYEFCSEVLIKAHHYKLNLVNVPIKVYYPKDYHRKGQNLGMGIRTAFNLLHHSIFKN